jgi:hypothetical protein
VLHPRDLQQETYVERQDLSYHRHDRERPLAATEGLDFLRCGWPPAYLQDERVGINVATAIDLRWAINGTMKTLEGRITLSQMVSETTLEVTGKKSGSPLLLKEVNKGFQ